MSPAARNTGWVIDKTLLAVIGFISAVTLSKVDDMSTSIATLTQWAAIVGDYLHIPLTR